MDYNRTERVQFEDDEYYYYVKAVPKNTVKLPEPAAKKAAPVKKTAPAAAPVKKPAPTRVAPSSQVRREIQPARRPAATNAAANPNTAATARDVVRKTAIDAAKALLSGAPTTLANPAPAVASVQSVAPVAPAAEVSAPVNSVIEYTQESPQQNDSDTSSLGINPIPKGLPRLSMLDELDNQEQQAEDESNPFYDGGPLPPQQSVDAKISTVVTASETGYTLNPDDEDDGWTNTDTPPEDDYYSEELQAQQAQESRKGITVEYSKIAG